MRTRTATQNKTRILSAFMAFLIFALSFQQLFVGWGLRVGAADITTGSKFSDYMTKGLIGSTAHDGYSVSKGNIGNESSVEATFSYEYTGKVKSTKVSLYDYLSDAEISGGTPVSMYTNYGCEPFDTLNRAISEDFKVNSESQNSNNITIRFKLGSNINWWSKVYVYFWDSSGHSSNWDGPDAFTLDGSLSDGYSTTINLIDDSAANYLSFVPEHLIFHNTYSGARHNQTVDIDVKLNPGYTYSFETNGSEDSNGKYEVDRKDDGTVPANYTNNKVCKYNIPLYFGCFYRENQKASTYTDDMKPTGQTFGNNELTAGGPYANFWWQANLGQKSTGDGTGNNSVDIRGHAAVQGLVDDKLTTDSDLNTADPDGKLRQNGVELPYFSTTFEHDNPNLMRIIDNNTKGIDFPFYEIKAKASTVRGTVTENSDDVQARFYQFNSKESTLHLEGESNNWHFKETGVQIQSNNMNPGFFPFDSATSNDNGRVSVNNNVGFGTKFEMRFKLKEDGQVYPVDSDGNEIKDKGKIHTMFEFIGDDDLWVFIDGNLVLDLGGCHDQTSGMIDFAEKKAYANKALNIKADGNNKDDLGAVVGIQTLQGSAFTDKIDGYADGKYNKNTTHTMTIYYLERGMMDSNLLVRFNFTPESTFSKMKIAEVTSFSKVNEGLKSYTRQAANKDVFKYTVENCGTSTSDIADSSTGILYPTYDQYDRKNYYVTDDPDHQGTNPVASTTLTSTTLAYTNESDPNAVFFDAEGTLGNSGWDKDGAIIAAIIWKSSDTSNGKENTSRLYKGTKVNGHIYKFDGFPSDADHIRFIRLNPANNYVWGGVRKNNDYTGCWGGQTNGFDFSSLKGKKFTITGWNNGTNAASCNQPNSSDSNYSYQVQSYEKNTYDPGTAEANVYKPVANTNYLWEDNFKALVGDEKDQITGMTGKTTADGSLYLMYGSGRPYGDGRESSAEFENTFKPGVTATEASTMKVVQSDTLTTPTAATPAALTGSSSGRTVSKYYNTTVQLFDRQNNTRTIEPSRGTDYQTTFPFKHITQDEMAQGADFKEVPTYLTVMLTEVFTNEVKVGAISVQKTLANGETGPEQVHTFQLTLTDVMENGVNVPADGYGDISITCTTETNASGKLNADGTFTIKGTGTATITGIPVGTTYTITETTPGSYFNYTSITNNGGKIEEGNTPTANNQLVVTNTRKTGSLTLSKHLLGANNAKGTAPDASTPFTLQVTLNVPTGQNVNLENYFSSSAPSITTTGSQTGTISLVSHTSAQYVCNVTVYPDVNSNSNAVTITGIPYGTTVSVSEVTDGNKQQVQYTATADGSTYSRTIDSPSTVVNVTNIYRKVTMTKKDSKDTDKNLSGATYVLVKLKDAALSNGALVSAAITAFNSAFASDFSDTLPAPLSTYIEDRSSILTTNGSGVVEVNDSMMTNGLRPGNYFFIELTAPANYETNNNSTVDYKNGNSTATQNKVFAISAATTDDQTSTEIYYYDDRLVGALIVQENVLQSTIDAYAASANQNFTVSVTLDGTASGVEIDPGAFFTDSDLTGMGVTAGSIDRTVEHKLSFTLPVSKNSTASGVAGIPIVGIPLGVSYSVTQTLPDISSTLPGSRWVNVGNNNLNNSITGSSDSVQINNVSYHTETAAITNAMVGSFVLSKALASGTNNDTNESFTFNVNMTIPNDVDSYSFKRAEGTGTASVFTSYTTSGKNISFAQAMSDGDNNNITISGIPYGTTYNVSETAPGGDWGIVGQVNTTNQTVNNVTKTTTITNGKFGSLTLNKIITGPFAKYDISAGDEFEFNVTLTSSYSLDSVQVNGTPTTVTSGTPFTVRVPSVLENNTANPVVISKIPYGTSYSVVEVSSYIPTGTGAGVSYAEETTKTIDGSGDTVTATNTYVDPPPMSVSIDLTKTDSKTGAAITDHYATYRLLKLNDNVALSAFANACKNSSAYTDLSSYYSTASDQLTTDGNGKISISSSNFSALGNVYPGDIFFFYEVTAPNGYKTNNTVTEGKLITIVKGQYQYSVNYPDDPNSTGIPLLKVDKENNNPLADAVFDLYFRENDTPPTFSINESEISPKLLASRSINSANTMPEPPAVSNSDTVTTTKFNYTAASAPDASESTWILPRTDNDYIFFRDYETGTADHDPGLNGHAWLDTGFETNVHGQQLEIKYDHSYWYAAQFRKEGSSSTVQYAVWERFVDKYEDKNTIVWKIQPPDGYQYVRFLLYHNNKCIRTTEEFTYELGKLYQKTSWGGVYKNENGEHCYFNVPVDDENATKWSSYYTAANTTTGNSNTDNDHRIASTTELYQADKYTATPQKLVFHCNSKIVWHNIHIEFFAQDGTTPVGQSFPGYMMEPYAYAGNDYRINGYLTYELTIPKDAKYFRVNNGVTMDSTYGYYSKITEIYSGDTNKYYKISGSSASSDQKNITLTQSTSFATNANKTYSNQNEIESDYDYVYFATPTSGGWDKVYAYFYGGGNLREDNWQRACYSIWPGLAPVGTEYTADENGTNVQNTSDIYTYGTNPDSTFAWENYTVYKFRIPLGDRTNYSKVIFNNGLKSQSGGKETGVISYKSGYIYKKDGTSTKHYEEKSTYTYTGRGDELYVKMNSSTLADWDDLHITFYDSGKNQILQAKSGYVMKYSGTDSSSNTYFSMPIPSAAAYFSLNNGIDKSSPHNLSLSDKYEILPLDASGNEDISQNFTKGNMVYTLSGTTLSKTLPEFTEDTSSTQVTLDVYPSPRGDYIYIKDVNSNTLSPAPPSFTFYDSSNNTITSPGVNSHAQEGDDKWYSVGIPLNAVKFTINGGSTKYDIYERTTETSTSDDTLNFTPGGMYYEATGNNTLNATPLWPTFSNSSEATNYTDDNWGTNARGDALYLVCDADKKSAWVGMTVTFYDESGTAISNGTKTGILANYIGELTAASPDVVNGESTDEPAAVGHWFKVNIPKNAKTFVATANNNTTATGDIYELRTKMARYRDNYTLGDMQYHIDGTISSGKYPLTLFYPVFTQDTTYTMPDHDDISSSAEVNLVDESDVENYIDVSLTKPSTTSGTSDAPVLHQTASNTVTYTWQEGGSADPNYVMLCDPENKGGSTSWKAYLWSNGSEGQVVSCDPSYETNSNGHKVYKFNITGINKSNIIFTTKPYAGSDDWGSGYQTADLDISSYNNGHGYTYTLPWTETLSSTDYISAGSYVYFKKPNPSKYANPYSSAGWNTLRVEFSNSSTSETYYMNDSRISNAGSLKKSDNTSISGSFWKVYFDPEKKWTKVQFYDGDYGATVGTSTRQARSQQKSLNNYLGGTSDTGKMNYFEITIPSGGISNGENTTTAPVQVLENTNNLTHDASWSESVTQKTYSSQFQPEDRYGLIVNTYSQSDTNGTTTTTNNFVKVVNEATGLSDLRIKFFTDSAGATRADVTTGVSGQTFPDNGIKLKPATVSTTFPAIDGTQYTVGDGSSASPYLVRLPKNAKYARLFDGSTAVGGIVALADSSGKTGGVTLTVTESGGNKVVTPTHPSRGGTDIQVSEKKTDMDYIFFTDVDNELGSSIHAYYFGDTDGEFCAWPGVAPSYSYTDNDNNTVYAFQYPTVANSTAKAYPYVIFNSGGNYPSTKMTTAQQYSGAENYSKTTGSGAGTEQYGVDGSSNPINALKLSYDRKTGANTVNYSSTNKYIFFVNNGTYNFGQLSGNRYILDDVHITFFDLNKDPLSTIQPGYVMDKVGTYNNGGTNCYLYRMVIPSEAQYFQINNGTEKGSGTANNNLRNSVIEEVKQNGLYKFVDDSTATADVWEGTSAATSKAELDDHNYKLTWINKIVYESDDEEIPETRTYDVHLATVVTKGSTNTNYGNISMITWLKPAVGMEDETPQTTVDTEYLDYDSLTGVLNAEGVTEVKVKKLGTYYWKESGVPTGYKIPDGEPDQRSFTLTAYGTPPAIADVTFKNEKLPEPTNKVILTKTAKEKVGSHEIGSALTGAEFLLYKSDGDNDDSNDQLAGSFSYSDGEYTFGSGNFNTSAGDSSTYMQTGTVSSDTAHYCKLTLNGLPKGDYYLKEVAAPTGYTVIDSNTGTNRRVYFSIGENTETKELTCADEMDAAYIRLFEHIDDYMPDEWGQPTFIFRITRSGGKTSYVSLTFDSNKANEQTIADTIKWYDSSSPVIFGNSGDPISSTYNNWYVEGTTESEYEGMYHIDSKGRIRVEPGDYTVTRIPVSRYEFEKSGHLVYLTDTEPNGTYTVNGTGTEAAEAFTLTAGQTADVHYYDKLSYYDKFTHADDEVNKFYTLDNNKNNKTIKGIRIADYHSTASSGSLTLVGTTVGSEVGAVPLTVYAVYADGTEERLTASDELAKIKFLAYTPAEGENPRFTPTLLLDGKYLKVNDVATYKNNVYTITATYTPEANKEYKTTFDLVF